jgi:sugar phosphate isomerase/epimerase
MVQHVLSKTPAPLGFPDLVLCESTIRPCPLEEFVAAAAGSGCAGISVRAGTVAEALSRLGEHGVLALLGDQGVQVADIDALVGWLREGDLRWSPQVPTQFRLEPEQFLDLAASVGARAVNAVELSDVEVPLELIAERFGVVCDGARERNLLVYVEFFQGSVIKDMGTAAEVVRLSGRRNGGILLDSLHYYRGPSLIERHIDDHCDLVRMLQVSDVPAGTPVDQWEERQSGRLLPGDGVIDLVDLLTSVQRAGVSAPVGIEVSSRELREQEPLEAARRAVDATRQLLRSIGVEGSGSA